MLQSSAGRHHPQASLLTQSGLHLRQIRGENGLHSSLHNGRLPPWDQTRQWSCFMGTDHRAESCGSDRLRQLHLVPGITPGMHQSDRTGTDAGLVMTNKPLQKIALKP